MLVAFSVAPSTSDAEGGVAAAVADAVAAHGPRVSLVLKADIRPGRSGELTGKLARLERAVESAGAAGADG